MASSRTKQQHYVSRFYLDYFKDTDGLVWTYDTANDKVWPAIPDNTAKQANLYSPKDKSGQYIDELEEWLSGVEDKAAPLYPQVLDGKVLADQERADFAVFLASLYARSPANIRMSAEMQGQFAQVLHDAYLSDRDAYEKMMDKVDEKAGKTTSKEMRDQTFKFAKDKDAYTLVVKQQAGLLGISVSDSLTPVFFDMKWDLIVISDQHLVTSDNPVVRVTNPADHHPIYGDGGFRGKSTYVTVPLSPTRLLRLRWSDEPAGPVLCGNKVHGRLFNRQRAYFSENYLFASKNDDGIRRLGQKHKDAKHGFEVVGRDMAEVEVER